MYDQFKPKLQEELKGIKEAGLFKKERVITSPQSAEITIAGGQKVLNF
ncbi:MAG: glycine C-acetyltransferase, partial [Algoriphagus sp.]